ncbi:MAG: hypothetical protein KGH88_06035 [Thaumarchaeota archaeon]|nr:hypothetical protein [Nitrososphaerota archaeon]
MPVPLISSMKILNLSMIVISAVCLVIFHSNSIIAYADTRYYDQIPVPPIQILSANRGSLDLEIKQGVSTSTATVSFDQKTYKVGDTATITVNDPNLDTDNDLVVTYSSVLPVGTLSNPQDPATDTVGQAGLGTYSDGTPIGMLFDIQWGQQDRRWSNSDVPTNKITVSCWGGASSSTGTPGRFATGLGASGFFLAETAASSGVFQGTFEIPDSICLALAGTTGGPGVSAPVNGMNIKASYYFRDESGKLVEVSDNAGIRGMPSGVRQVFVSTDKYVYMPGDVVLIKGESYLNDTDAKISLEKNDKTPVITKDIPINKNGTFYANFTIPFDTTARSWWLATTVGGGTLDQGIHFKSESIPPLDQFWSGISPSDTLCKPNLTLIFKTKDGSPACVKPDTAQKLIERGWAKKIVSSASTEKMSQTNSDPLELLLSINSTIIRPNQTLGIDIILNNTSPNILVKDSKNNWPMEGLNMGPCELDPVGIGVYKGNYSPENVTGTRPLQLYQNGTYQCQMLVGVDRYVFEPSSDKAISETGNGNSTGEMKYGTSFHGYYTKGGFVLPSVGTYTVIAGDEWGHTTIQHFMVTNSTVSNGLQTSQTIPQCISNIPHLYATADPPGFPLCPVAGFQASGQIVNSTGFYGIYNYTKYPDTQNFVLEPGHNATITYKISVGTIHSWASTTSSNEINLTNYVTLMHDAGMHDHPGVYVSVYPTSEVISQNGSAIIAITLSASKDASYGTYWMQLPPGICFGGEDVILTVTDCTGKK